MTPLRHIYRAAIRRAGIFEAPPAMVKAITEWLYSVAASHVLAEVQDKLAKANDPTEPVKKAITAIDEFLATVEAKAKGLQPKQYLRFAVPPVAGFKPRVVGIKNLYGQFQPGWGEASVTFYGLGDLSMAISSIQMKLGDRRKVFERHLGVKGYETIGDKEFLNLQMLKRECLKYTSTAKRYTSKATRAFSVDLTGWKYAKPNSPVIKVYNDRVSKNNQVIEEGIKKAEADLRMAQQIYDKEIKGETISDAEAGRLSNAGYWNEWRVEQAKRNEERPSEAWGDFNLISMSWAYPSPERLLAEDARKKILPLLGPEEVTKAVQQVWRDKIVVNLFFTRRKGYVGQWYTSKGELQVVMGGLEYIHNAPYFQEAIEHLGSIVRHEVQHVGQDALRSVAQLKKDEEGGLPSRSLREKGVGPGGSITRSKKIEHPLRDVEFYTDLADAVERFMARAKEFSNADTPVFFRQFVGLSIKGLGELSRLHARPDTHFWTWKTKAPEKWQKAVKELGKALSDKGYNIYGTGKVLARAQG